MKKDGLRIHCTRNYGIFVRDDSNRPLQPERRKRLIASMERYGFLSSFPIVCQRTANRKLLIKDGQHRSAIAQTLGLPICYVIEDVPFDVAEINSTGKVWQVSDYAQAYAAQGKVAYQKGLDLSRQFGIPVGVAFAMLAGCTGFTNVQPEFVEGRFEVRDWDWASRVSGLYRGLYELNPVLKNVRFLSACMAVCRVPGFSVQRMEKSARRCRHKLAAFSTRDAYLDMLDEIYNYGRVHRVGLKFEAENVMRARNPVIRGEP